jgi:hypothetical protein
VDAEHPCAVLHRHRSVHERTLVSSHQFKAAPPLKIGATERCHERRATLPREQCLLAAKTCEFSYRSLILAVSAAWYALAIQDEEIERLLAKWSEPAPVQVPAPAEILASRQVRFGFAGSIERRA